MATAIDNLQSSNSYYAIFLPTLHSIKYSLDDLKKSRLKYCAPLLGAIKAGFEKRFFRFFDKFDEQCIAATIAAVTHPHFKVRWIHEDFCSREYIEEIRETMISLSLESSNHDENMNVVAPKPQGGVKKKRFLYRFNTGSDVDQERENGLNRESAVRIEVESWLGSAETEDEDNLSSIQGQTEFPNIRKLFIKYNTITSSSAPVERLFSFASMSIFDLNFAKHFTV